MIDAIKIQIDKYELEPDRLYDRETHLWMAEAENGRYRCGFDPLGAETSGDIVAIAFEPIGQEVAKGGGFGSLEAAKFVGPLLLPVAGKVVAHNEQVLADPGCIHKSPFEHWLVEIDLADEASLDELLSDSEELRSWFAAEIESYRSQGALAE